MAESFPHTSLVVRDCNVRRHAVILARCKVQPCDEEDLLLGAAIPDVGQTSWGCASLGRGHIVRRHRGRCGASAHPQLHRPGVPRHPDTHVVAVRVPAVAAVDDGFGRVRRLTVGDLPLSGARRQRNGPVDPGGDARAPRARHSFRTAPQAGLRGHRGVRAPLDDRRDPAAHLADPQPPGRAARDRGTLCDLGRRSGALDRRGLLSALPRQPSPNRRGSRASGPTAHRRTGLARLRGP